jgi:hypothetical protein
LGGETAQADKNIKAVSGSIIFDCKKDMPMTWMGKTKSYRNGWSEAFGTLYLLVSK